jgi:hypothetical protein
VGGSYAPPGARRIWGRLELTAEQTLADLGDAIPLASGFDDREFLFLFDDGDEWHFGVKLIGTGQPTRPGVRYP